MRAEPPEAVEREQCDERPCEDFRSFQQDRQGYEETALEEQE